MRSAQCSRSGFHGTGTEDSQVLAIHVGQDRGADDEDLKGATLLFASRAGKHITGQVLAGDGGVSRVFG